MRNMNEEVSVVANQEEQHLLGCALAGSSEAFDRLVKPHWDALLRVTQRILRNREDAEDTVQTTVLNAWLNLDTFEVRSRFPVWLIRIAINSAFIRLRANPYKNEVSLDDLVCRDSRIRLRLLDSRLDPEQELSAKEALSLVG
jgi:RNA polymerase sigma-70 factor, ECF subfamily